jgi:hypothetical protein
VLSNTARGIGGRMLLMLTLSGWDVLLAENADLNLLLCNIPMIINTLDELGEYQ